MMVSCPPSSLDHGCWAPAHLKGFLVNYNIQTQISRKYFLLAFTYFRSVRQALGRFYSQSRLFIFYDDISDLTALKNYDYILNVFTITVNARNQRVSKCILPKES